MPCSFHCDGQFDRGLVKGVSRAITAFGSIPGALSIARSSGNEQTVGRLLLGAIEEETRCLAFAEENRQSDCKRNDYAMRCVNCPEDEDLAVLELKHNMAHATQLWWIRKEKSDVQSRLRGLPRGNNRRNYYHIHFIFGLGHAPDSPVAEFHNKKVKTGYKQFLPLNKLDEVMEQITSEKGALAGARS